MEEKVVQSFPLLPRIEDKNIVLEHFPSVQAAVIFRLWKLAPAKKIARILSTDEGSVSSVAQRMGLGAQKIIQGWMTRGYITILKSVWHLLPYGQILELLDWNEEKLAFVLKEDDFLSIKLGDFKPLCRPVRFNQPSPDEWRGIDRIGGIIRREFGDLAQDGDREPFDFFTDDPLPARKEPHPLIDNRWTVCDRTGWSDTGMYTDDFIDSFRQVWGVGLRKNKENERFSILLLRDDSVTPDEAYSLGIDEEKITVRASGPAGIFRALCDLLQTKYYPGMKINKKPRFLTRIIYSFCGLYGNALDEDTDISYPDKLLRQYSLLGINAVWLPGILYQLSPFPFAPEYSRGWEKRLDHLRKLTERAKRFGIKVFIYLNEPRGMPLSFFERYPELKGHVEGNQAALCTSDPRVLAYLGGAAEQLCRAAPDLGGFFMINMSENLTHCHSRGNPTSCPRCKNRSVPEVMTEVIGTIAGAVKKTGLPIQTWAWTWAWKQALTAAEFDKVMDGLPENVTVMAVAEADIPFTIGGVPGIVTDYSMSIPGPGEPSISVWRQAAGRGLDTAAKIQINTTWECSTAPFLPVYRLVNERMEGLCKTNVRHLLLSWTLGGYPSDTIRFASRYFYQSDYEKETEDGIYEKIYGEDARTVKQAAEIFSDAFKEFPFDCQTLYCGPQNLGPANLLYKKPTGLCSTMTGFAYDDLEKWRSIYPVDIFASQFKKLSEKWREGIYRIKDLPESEFKDAAQVGYALFRSSYNQIRYILLRENAEGNRKEISEVLAEEVELAKLVYKLMARNPSIGYEAANHYYFEKGMMLEKVINCVDIMTDL